MFVYFSFIFDSECQANHRYDVFSILAAQTANVLITTANVFYLKNRIYVRSLIIDNLAQIIDKDVNVEYFIEDIKFAIMTESESKAKFIEIIE